MAAKYEGIINFGGGELASQYADFAVAKYAPNGAHVWSRRIDHADSYNPARTGLAVSPEGTVVLRGLYLYVSVDDIVLESNAREVFALAFGP